MTGRIDKPQVLYASTPFVLPDEKAISLSECDHVMHNTNEPMHRFQRIIVIRNDRPTIYERDLGRSFRWNHSDAFMIVSALEYSVAELQEMARQQRFEMSPFDKRELAQVDNYRAF